MKRGSRKGMLVPKNNTRKINISRTSEKVRELDSFNQLSMITSV